MSDVIARALSTCRLLLLALAAMATVAGLEVAAAAPAWAHDGNVGLSEITVADRWIDYHLYLDARQLSDAVPLGPEGDVALPGTAAGTKVRQADLLRLVQGGITVESAGADAEPTLVTLDTTSTAKLTHLGGVSLLADIPLLHMQLRYTFPADIANYRIGYSLFPPDKGRQPHSNLAWLHEGRSTSTFIFTPGGPPLVPGAARPVAAVPRESSGGGLGWVLGIAGAVLVVAVIAAVVIRRSRAARQRRPVRGKGRR